MFKLAILSIPAVFILNVCFAQKKVDTVINNDVASFFKPVKWRCIGPYRGGRSVCATGVVNNISTYYMGTTGGGLWKTEDMGITWNNISDGYFKTGSVGAVAVAESNANIVYVGMGEHAVRGVMTHHGDGVYATTDAGKTWIKKGLDATQHIARIIIHPTNAAILFVAAQGALYSKSAQRGIYKSIDGGTTFKQILFIDSTTGCTDISMDASNPNILYAAMWQHNRLPWQIISGPNSGLYKSIDAGEHWQKMEDGLPIQMGKVSIAVAKSNTEKVYALIESDYDKEAGGLYISTNAGKTWSQITSDHRLIQRAWYYTKLFIDPNNENTLYVMSAPALRSIDGGKTWDDISNTHGDYHHLWINPANSNNMIIADDGGAAITFNQGKTWSSQQNMPTGQFYRINTDNQFPYHIYGGQQDDGTVNIASRELGGSGISTNSWSYSAGGESAFLAFNPDEPNLVLGGSYMGTIEAIDTKAKASTNIMATPIQYLAKETKNMHYRFNWNAPIIWSKHQPNVFYHAAQYLLRTSDTGKTWTVASPDLTRNEKLKQGKGGTPFTNEAVGAENYGTISYVIESPLEKGVIWTGSDDGLVYLTKDNGASWQNVTPAGLQECLINAIEVSPHDKATAYIATTRYKFNDHTPAIYKTTNYGKTWSKIVNGIDKNAFTRVVREDDKIKNLLFAGTELGLYISYNGGINWQPFQLNLPITPITDLKIHQHNLIAATSGRGFWVLDDLELIRQYSPIPNPFFIFNTSPTYLVNGSSELDETNIDFTGVNKYQGVNPATGMVLYYHLPALKDEDQIELQIKDATGKVVNTFTSQVDSTYKKYDGGPKETPTLSKNKGLNRFVWNLRYPTIGGVPGVYIEASYKGHKAIPGSYYITLISKTKQVNCTATILPNPLYKTNNAAYTNYNEMMQAMEAEVVTMHNLVNSMYSKQQQLTALIAAIPSNEKYTAVKNIANQLVYKMKTWDETMIQRKSKAYDDVENFENKFTANYMFLINQTESDIPKVNQPSIDRWKVLQAQWKTLQQQANDILNNDVPALNKLMWDTGIGAIWK
jgi:photosystem II stability/assembly factor-like uncharacterized protein